MPRASRRSLEGDAAWRKFIDRSEESKAIPSVNVVKTAPARAASATNASVPPPNTPAAVRHHGLAGMDHVEVPVPASSTTSPLRWVSGGAGSFRSMNSCSWSTPGRANNPGLSR